MLMAALAVACIDKSSGFIDSFNAGIEIVNATAKT